MSTAARAGQITVEAIIVLFLSFGVGSLLGKLLLRSQRETRPVEEYPEVLCEDAEQTDAA